MRKVCNSNPYISELKVMLANSPKPKRTIIKSQKSKEQKKMLCFKKNNLAISWSSKEKSVSFLLQLANQLPVEALAKEVFSVFLFLIELISTEWFVLPFVICYVSQSSTMPNDCHHSDDLWLSDFTIRNNLEHKTVITAVLATEQEMRI